MQTFVAPTGLTTTFQYDKAAQRTTVLYRSGLTRRQTFDPVGQIVSLIDEKSGTPLTQFTFTYDGVGNRTSIKDSNGATTTYSYDAKNRLTQDATAGTNPHTYDYGYDANDNRLTSTETGFLVTSTYDRANRLQVSLSGANRTTYTYDANGNLTKVDEITGVTTLLYEQENRLSRHENGGVVSTYLYDGDGKKRVELVSGAYTTLVWDGADYLQARS